MRCPFCHDNDDKVIDSRATDSGKAIRRRRQCNACGKRFTTRELVEENVRMTVVKKDGSRMPYDRQKMLAGLQNACYKRTVSVEQLTGAVEQVEEELFRRGEREVASLDIGRLLAGKLKAIDPVAYLRFASVYMEFKDIDDLISEAQEVKAQQPPPPEPDQGQLF